MQTLKFIYLFIVLTVFTFGINAQINNSKALFPVCKKKEKCGYIDITGKMIIEPKFIYTGEFSDGLAEVRFKSDEIEKSGFIDKTGNVIFEHTFYYVYNFSEGLARFQKDENSYEYGFIDKTGNVVIEPTSNNVGDFHEGVAKISVEQKKDQNTTDKKVYKFCFINKKGEIIIPCEFDGVSDFSEGFAVAFINKRAGFIDIKGDWLVGNVFIDAKPFSEGLAAVEGFNAKGERGWGFINKNTDVVIGPQYSNVSSFSDGLAAVRHTNNPWGYIDQKGKIIIPFQFSPSYTPGDFSEGYAGVYIRGGEYDVEFAYIDKTGKRLNRKTYTHTDPFKNGLAKAWRYNYLKALLAYGLFRKESGGSEYYIDRTGKTIWKGKDQ